MPPRVSKFKCPHIIILWPPLKAIPQCRCIFHDPMVPWEESKTHCYTPLLDFRAQTHTSSARICLQWLTRAQYSPTRSKVTHPQTLHSLHNLYCPDRTRDMLPSRRHVAQAVRIHTSFPLLEVRSSHSGRLRQPPLRHLHLCHRNQSEHGVLHFPHRSHISSCQVRRERGSLPPLHPDRVVRKV